MIQLNKNWYNFYLFSYKRSEMLSRREQLEKDFKAIMSKPIGAKNPIFEEKFIVELHSMFSLYADPRQRRA